MIAISTLRTEPHYRKAAFHKGLTAAGYDVVEKGRPESKRDLLLVWNRYGPVAAMADTWERTGGRVLVCENGYAGADTAGHQFYAIAARGHNGSGWVPDAPGRFQHLNLQVKSWTPGDHILVCGQRGIGSKVMASPEGWHTNTERALRKLTKRPVKVRHHPGSNRPASTTLEQDLTGAHACVIWSSSSGVKALLLGVPVFYDAPHWICQKAALAGTMLIEKPLCSDVARSAALDHMAAAQWSIAEIESGEPFIRFLQTAGEAPW